MTFALLAPLTARSQDTTPPALVFNPISVRLEGTGRHVLTVSEIARIAAGSRDASGITNTTVTPSAFTFCDAGAQVVTLTLKDSVGNTTNHAEPIQVLPPASSPHTIFVDARYPSTCAQVAFPYGNPSGAHFVNFDAFNSIQAAVDHLAENGTIHIAAGTYAENVLVTKALSLLGPNAGLPGNAPNRSPEARIIPLRSDPENAPIISVESDNITVDGLCLDGSNPQLSGGYNANSVRVHAAAGIQNGTYPDLADVERITIRNNIITNISYDGICLDRYQYYGTSSAWNYIQANKLANMWEGILTYALDSVIANNVISNVTHGLGVHCVNTAAPPGFFPVVASNTLTIAQWWPEEIQPVRAPGIWINYRRENASPIAVVGNVVNTPTPPSPFKTIIGLYALTVDGRGKVDFIDNTVNGAGNCTVGLLAASCWSNSAVQLLRGSLHLIHGTGVLADTRDVKWGPGNCVVTVSNVDITLSPGGVGLLVWQEEATPANTASLMVISNTSITGGICAVQVSGTNASASLLGNQRPMSGNDVGVFVSGGRALLEGNTLTNNRLAALVVENDGIVDAGDCSGANITGLGTGNGANGASAGLNDFSGYGFDKLAPWAISNSSTVPIRADRNVFKASTGENIRDALTGVVNFSDSRSLRVSAPPDLEVECFSQVPLAAKSVEEFVRAGGVVASGLATSIGSSDVISTNSVGHYTVTRSYTLAGGCDQAVSCNQLITARDDQGPIMHCSGNIVQAVDKGCPYATVTFTNLAADSCGELSGPWLPSSTGQFPIGTNRVIVIATDLANNSTACSFDVAVIGPPIIRQQPASRTNNIGTTASFKVAATSPAPLSFRWKQNGVQLTDGGKLSGTAGAELVVSAVSQTDAADYQVDVSNFAGVTSSAKAHLSVVVAQGNLRILGVSNNEVKLAITGPAGYRFGILTSTNLMHWVGLWTNRAPFAFPHTNSTVVGCRFYRALHVP